MAVNRLNLGHGSDFTPFWSVDPELDLALQQLLEMGRLIIGAEFVLKNFAAPIAFFLMFHFRGAKPAIALALAVTLVQLVVYGFFKIKITPFFGVATGFTVVFGVIDLLIDSPRFFRLEPFAQNFLLGVLFALTLLRSGSIAEWFVTSLPESLQPKMGEGLRGYLRAVTLAWAIYFVLKSFVFLYLAFRVDLGRLVILRTVIGGGSLALMVSAELLIRKKLFGR